MLTTSQGNESQNEPQHQQGVTRPQLILAVKNVKRYLINYPVFMSMGRQYFVFLFRQGIEQPHQGDMNNSISTNMFLIHKNKFRGCNQIRLDPV
jgi:hypothetical protein